MAASARTGGNPDLNRPAGAPLRGTRLCALDEIAEPGARGFVFGSGSDRLELFVVRSDGAVRAFVNACPHQGTPLETFPDRFLTRDSSEILCTTHGARFRIADGHCLAGPCRGQALTPVQVHVVDGEIRIA